MATPGAWPSLDSATWSNKILMVVILSTTVKVGARRPPGMVRQLLRMATPDVFMGTRDSGGAMGLHPCR
jgi:hypothetical protein